MTDFLHGFLVAAALAAIGIVGLRQAVLLWRGAARDDNRGAALRTGRARATAIGAVSVLLVLPLLLVVMVSLP